MIRCLNNIRMVVVKYIAFDSPLSSPLELRPRPSPRLKLVSRTRRSMILAMYVSMYVSTGSRQDLLSGDRITFTNVLVRLPEQIH